MGKKDVMDSATALRVHASCIRALGKRVADDIIEIGRHLTEAKRITGHGDWLPWLGKELGWDERQICRIWKSLSQAFICSQHHQLPSLPEPK
jgi:Protein of unknown function (DUF3102)